MNKPLLKVKGLKKYFPIYAGLLRHQVGDIKAVDGLDFCIGEKEILGMVGESGSGKSTAARAAIHLIEPTSGESHFEGKNILNWIQDDYKNLRRRIQIVFQDPYASLNPRKTVFQSIGEGLWFHQLVSAQSEGQDRVAEILTRVGLSPDAMHRYPHQFSGGQQQRICIGRAIAMSPRLIICDEAVSALDVSVQAQILNLLSELQASMGMSYLFISHDLSVIRHISERVVVMRAGQVVETGSVDAIFSQPKASYTKKLLAAIPQDFPKRI